MSGMLSLAPAHIIFKKRKKSKNQNAQRPTQFLTTCTTCSHNLVAAPLDGVEINTLLDQLPQRTQFTQESNAFLHSLEHVVDFGIGGEATNAETNTAVSALVTAAEGTENI